MTDAFLVEECLAGDMNAFGKIVDRYSNAVYGLCYHKMGNFEDAEELAQDTFVKAYFSLKQLRDATKLAPWLYKIAANLCKMRKRAQGEKDVPFDEAKNQGDTLPSVQEQLEAEELHSLVRKAMSQISENSRLVMTLFYFDDCSYKEIASFLGVSVQTVKSRLHEAKKQLRRELLRIVDELFKGRRLKDEFTKDVLARCRCGCLPPADRRSV